MTKWRPVEKAPRIDGFKADLWCKQWRPGGSFIHRRFMDCVWLEHDANPRWSYRNVKDPLFDWEPTHYMQVQPPEGRDDD